MTKSTKQEIAFEQAFERLEKILELMNKQEVSLDDSLKLYEEADGLISLCAHKLKQAEKRIETLIKNREGGLAQDEQGDPQKTPFPRPDQG